MARSGRGAEAFGRDGVTGSGTLRDGIEAQPRGGDGGTAGFALQCSGSTDSDRHIGIGLIGLGKGRAICRVLGKRETHKRTVSDMRTSKQCTRVGSQDHRASEIDARGLIPGTQTDRIGGRLARHVVTGS